jgi:predicted RNase H-like nuclease (RuvC/YqgF family)
MENQTDRAPKRNSNVIYFLIVVILALVGSDIYLLLTKNKTESIVVTQQGDKERLRTELDSLENQIEQVNSGKTKITAELQAKNDSLKIKIKELRHQLDRGKLTRAELTKAQEDVKQLRYFVTKYTADIDELKKQNESLTTERDTLKTNLVAVKQKATTLQKQNEDLGTKVQIASALKIGSINISTLKLKSSGKEVEKNRAAVTKKIKIDFTIPSNAVAEKRMHDVYVRIIDPTGNLMTQTDSGNFQADGQDFQYTFKAAIDFKDDGSGYSIDWVNPGTFQKGAYTVLLYSDGYTMGKSSFTLK